MKNTKFFIYAVVLLLIMFGFAFAQPNINKDDVFKNIVANTDAQFVSALSKSLDQDYVITVPIPSLSQERSEYIQLVDITKACTTNGGEVISAYPEIYKLIRSEENELIVKVFLYIDSKGGERRIEVYYTGGDWMQYGLVYFITNAGEDKNLVNAYFIDELSTPDHENGAIAPALNPFDPKKIVEFITSDFLEVDGNVKTRFSKVASTFVQYAR